MKDIKKIILMIMSFTMVLTISMLALGSDYNFVAHLSGKNAGVDAKAQGQLILKFNKDYTELYYKLIVANIKDVTEAHIHGMDGMTVATLLGSAIDGRFDGILAEGTIKSISCHHGTSLEHLVMCIKQGHIYVDVHTVQNSDGEIKGQVK